MIDSNIYTMIHHEMSHLISYQIREEKQEKKKKHTIKIFLTSIARVFYGGFRVGHSHKRISLLDIRFRYGTMTIFISDTPLSPMGPSSPSQEGLFTDLRLLSLEKQLNIELKVTKLLL